MGENYVYMDDDEMTELQDMLDDMLSEESFSMNALDGATVYADPSPDYLLRVLWANISRISLVMFSIAWPEMNCFGISA